MQTTATLPPTDPIHGHLCCVKMTLAQQQKRQRRKLRQNKKGSIKNLNLAQLLHQQNNRLRHCIRKSTQHPRNTHT